MYWRLNRIQYPIYNLGPGKRIGIWVQGCSIRCKGCISPSLWTKSNGKWIDIERLVNQIVKIKDCYEGITISGGEPFDQYESLIAFSAYMKKKTDLTIYAFSGYTLREISDKHPEQLFMHYLDYLLDGRYLQQIHDNHNTRGSSNQALYRFQHGRPIQLESYFLSKRWSINLSLENQIFMSGIPKQNELNVLRNKLGDTGIHIGGYL